MQNDQSTMDALDAAIDEVADRIATQVEAIWTAIIEGRPYDQAMAFGEFAVATRDQNEKPN